MLPAGSVKFFSTQEVANLIGVHKVTLKRWLSSGRVKEPRHERIGRQNWRVWTERDVQRLRTLKEASYRKKPRRKKAGSMKARRSKS
jgi:excisionase family DNA binding protein